MVLALVMAFIYLSLYFPRKAKSATGPDKLGKLGAGRRLGPRI
jgi:hypothetical protein